MSPVLPHEKELQLARHLVEKLGLDLRGLRVLTECASGAYAYTALLARLAGAEVTALGRDSSYGTLEENRSLLLSLAERCGLRDGLRVCRRDELEISPAYDIVTNSGFVRPVDARILQALKPTAVVCLMWETWELRPGEIDMEACRHAGIPVIGTNEHFHLTDMYRYPGLLSLRLLFDMQIETANSELVLIGGNLTGRLIAEMWERIGLSFDWYTLNGNERRERCWKFSGLERLLQKKHIDAVICAEHKDKFLVAGKDAPLRFSALKEKFPLLRWGHLAGLIDAEELKSSGLFHHPERIMPFGYMSYSTDHLGPAPVLELNAAGLKVGEIAARARLAGAGLEESIRRTVEHGIGQDFEGGFLNYKA